MIEHVQSINSYHTLNHRENHYKIIESLINKPTGPREIAPAGRALTAHVGGLPSESPEPT